MWDSHFRVGGANGQLILEEAEMGAQLLLEELGADFAGDEPSDGFDEEGDGAFFSAGFIIIYMME
jgi:hypothetical protein